ncbi:MAG: 3D-(3,5/4)-trihydroxycyclohexane-1,2-dione acylhydrolase (decyclizing) [Clostridiales Family XIII bacterium]|jgi:3D-(3,5/4)-trihydroxycyclohexane-1,2-dione acylhydrolase (decyclizing)|nr:3D-(3,5/4)-trihydroxycyclohexane-1,2-dione acylhydrolase (decyclizing) [Clostridiales Family XIII bacterium]
MKYERLTTAQALIKFLDNQYAEFDGEEIKFVDGIAAIFGHGIVCGLGQALARDRGGLKYYQGKSEQGMAHMAAGFARQSNRKRIIAAASSIGPGAANMITAAATATVNNIPLLLFPGDAYASRQPDPVLQQVEQFANPNITTNDAYQAVCKYWDRIARPEQLMTAMINAMRVLTDPAETGAVCIALPQDTEGEAYDYPESFLRKRVHRIPRTIPPQADLDEVCETISRGKKPLVIVGGGAKYSEAGDAIRSFCHRFHIPFAETQAGKSAIPGDDPYCLGGIGATGNSAANAIAKKADVIISVGSRLSDFTTSSKWIFQNPDVKIVSVNASRFHAYKMDSIMATGDAKATMKIISERMSAMRYRSSYTSEIGTAKAEWDREMSRLAKTRYGENFVPEVTNGDPNTIKEFAEMTGTNLSQAAVVCKVRELIDAGSVVVGASGSLPGDLQRMWVADVKDSYHMEYGYSCMGYEIAAAVGAKLANPDAEVYAMLGDGSFYMLHTELLTALQERAKINILLFDNASYGCINNLETGKGIPNLGTEFRCADEHGNHTGRLFHTDFAKIAEGYGAVGYTVANEEELEMAILDAKKQDRVTLIDIKVLPKTMTHDYGSWWNTGLATENLNEEEKAALEENAARRNEARRY